MTLWQCLAKARVLWYIATSIVAYCTESHTLTHVNCNIGGFHVSSQITCSSSTHTRPVFAQLARATRFARLYTATSETGDAENLRVQYLNYRCKSVFRGDKVSESAT